MWYIYTTLSNYCNVTDELLQIHDSFVYILMPAYGSDVFMYEVVNANHTVYN